MRRLNDIEHVTLDSLVSQRWHIALIRGDADLRQMPLKLLIHFECCIMLLRSGKNRPSLLNCFLVLRFEWHQIGYKMLATISVTDTNIFMCVVFPHCVRYRGLAEAHRNNI